MPVRLTIEEVRERVEKVQGYEPFALDELLKTYDEMELLTDDEDQPEIWWTDSHGVRHRYYSDIYIPYAKKVIEVKSTYTAKLHPEKLARCRVAAEEAGYVYEVWVFTEKGVRTN